MRKFVLLALVFMTVGAGCLVASNPENINTQTEVSSNESAEMVVKVREDQSEEGQSEEDRSVVVPVDNYVRGRTFKTFGEYIQDRFIGYHVGDDVEVEDLNAEVPVRAIAPGQVVFSGFSSGYGGVIIINHRIEGEDISAIYGHVDLESTEFEVGDEVQKGEFLANLGDHESSETDGERKHLHFGMYKGSDVRLSGYVSSVEQLDDWINPHEFFLDQGLNVQSPQREYDADIDLGGSIYNLSFTIPAGWDVEYIPSLEALNLFVLDGDGSARERSQVFIRYFDASSFLTLNTVTIHETEDLTIGFGDYTARRYDIEKKSGVADFSGQPSWRNERHIVTDFRAENGFTRYFVVAKSPDLGLETYESILNSVVIK